MKKLFGNIKIIKGDGFFRHPLVVYEGGVK